MYAQHLGPESETRGSMNASLVEGATWDEAEVASNTFVRDALGGAVYARNLDWAQQDSDVMGQEDDTIAHVARQTSYIGVAIRPSGPGDFTGPGGGSGGGSDRSMMEVAHQEFYQPEPTLLDIASGAVHHDHSASYYHHNHPHSDDVGSISPLSLIPNDENGRGGDNGPPEISAQEAEFYRNQYERDAMFVAGTYSGFHP